MPLSSIDELQELISLGADEFYFGISLVKHLTDIESFSFRSFDFANLNSLNSLKEAKRAIKIIHNNDLKCYLTLNNDLFNLFKETLNILRKISSDLDGIIVTDIILIEKIKKNYPHLKIIASTRCCIFNTWDLKFYRDLGVNRFTLAHQFYFKDVIKMLEQFSNEEFEIFIKNNGCPYVNGMCAYMHNLDPSLMPVPDGPFCRLIERDGGFYLVNKDKNNARISIDAILKRYKTRQTFDCGICWLDKLRNFKNRIILKISGRGHTLEKKRKDLIFIKQSLKILEDNADKTKILSLYKKVYSEECFHRCCFGL